MNFSLLEFHPYTRTFSFIARAQKPMADNVIISASLESKKTAQIMNSWVEVKNQNNIQILSGSAVLNSTMCVSDLYIRIRFSDKNGCDYIITEQPRYVTSGIIGVGGGNDSFDVHYWSNKSISEPLIEGETGCISSERKLSTWDGVVKKSVFPISNKMNPTKVSITPNNGVVLNIDKAKLHSKNQSSSRLKALKNKHEGEVAWLIGNGPSVNVEDLELLKNNVTFCFNRFYLAYENVDFRPSYTVSGDAQMIKDFSTEMLDKSQSTLFLASETPPLLTEDYIWLRQLAVFPSIFSFSPEDYVTPGGSSPYVAMQLAYHMGIRKIYLYGFDFRYNMKHSVSENNQEVTGEGNHFIKNYRDGKEWVPPSYRNIMHSFWGARNLFESEDGFIKNCTHGGDLEVFERESFNQVTRKDIDLLPSPCLSLMVINDTEQDTDLERLFLERLEQISTMQSIDATNMQKTDTFGKEFSKSKIDLIVINACLFNSLIKNIKLKNILMHNRADILVFSCSDSQKPQESASATKMDISLSFVNLKVPVGFAAIFLNKTWENSFSSQLSLEEFEFNSSIILKDNFSNLIDILLRIDDVKRSKLTNSLDVQSYIPVKLGIDFIFNVSNLHGFISPRSWGVTNEHCWSTSDQASLKFQLINSREPAIYLKLNYLKNVSTIIGKPVEYILTSKGNTLTSILNEYHDGLYSDTYLLELKNDSQFVVLDFHFINSGPVYDKTTEILLDKRTLGICLINMRTGINSDLI